MPIALGRKDWWTSKTVRGATVAILAGIFGFATGDVEETAQLLTDLSSIIGGVLAIYGRFKATQRLR